MRTGIVVIIYTGILIYSSITDHHSLIISDKVNVIIMILALVSNEGYEILWNLCGALFITLPFLLIAVKTNQLGGGDIKFIFVNSTFLGFTKGYAGIIIGLFLVIIRYIYLKVRKREDKNRRIPLAPYLSGGFIITIAVNKLLLIL